MSAQLRFRPVRPLVLGLGILVAAVGFTLLTASTSTSALHVRGTLKSSFRPAYDILVRPNGTETTLERTENLVRPNFLSGVYGGISFKQWHEIERIPGVAVAAPIANVGYVLPFANVTIPITKLTGAAPYQLYRIKETWLANDGLSRYPGPDLYVYYTPRDRFVEPNAYSNWLEAGPNARPPQPSCAGFGAGQPQQPTSAFPPLSTQETLSCFPSTLFHGPESVDTVNGYRPPSRGFVGTEVTVYFPIYISAIDPLQEAKLVHLDRTIVSGRYLRPNEGFSSFEVQSTRYRVAPVIASSRSYVDERLRLKIERLQIPPATNVARALASGACTSASVPCPHQVPAPPGASYRNARQFVGRLSGRPIATRSINAGTIYRDLLTQSPLPGWPRGSMSFDSYWTTSPTRYRRLGPDHLAPIPVHNPDSVWRSQFSGFITPPLDNRDTQFRQLHARVSSNTIVGGEAQWNPIRVVGLFDPNKLPEYSPLTKVPLDTYYPPELLPANATAEHALHGRPLRPTQNLAGYIQQPPLFLTTMKGLQAFLNPSHWLSSTSAGAAIPRLQRLAPISAIRIKVAGVTGLDSLSLERIRVVAQEIHEATGLQVDITAGSSPHPVLISLPKGEFGRPRLLLREGWSKKGVSVSFLRALDRKDLAMFALILLVSAFFLANGASAAVRTRRTEIGTLLTLGWSPAEVFRAIIGELALVSVLAGIAGSGIAAILTAGLSLHFPLVDVLYVFPIAVGLTLLAGLTPAWQAMRRTPLDAIRPLVATQSRRGHYVRGLAGMALVNLRRLPTRTLVGGTGLTIGVAALTILLGIQRAFQGTLVGTVLGNAISLQVRSADYIALGLAIGLAVISVADVLYLNLRERAAELVTLQTTGWSSRELLSLLELEALALGLAASAAGGAIGLLIGTLLLGVPILPLGVGAAIAAGCGTIAAAAASLYPALQIGRLSAPATLSSE